MSASHEPPRPGDDATARRRAVVRTALIMAALAAAVYVAFILSGVLTS